MDDRGVAALPQYLIHFSHFLPLRIYLKTIHGISKEPFGSAQDILHD